MSFSGHLNIYNYYGTGTSSDYLYETMFYNHVFTFSRPMTATVSEDIRLVNGSIYKDLKTYAVPTIQITRHKQLGGAYGVIPALGGQRHHCFADWVYSQTTVNKYDSNRNVIGTVSASYAAPVILMTQEDHIKTASYGSSSAAYQYRNNQLALVQQGKYLAAMQMDINDIRSKFGNRYDGAISQMWNYAVFELGWYQ